MNILLSIPALPFAELTAAPDAGGLDSGTVLLGLLVVAVGWLASTVSSLRSEVTALKESLTAQPQAAPAAAFDALAVAKGPSAQEVAAIAAAVHCVLGASARVVAVVPPDANAQAWSREGRREVFQSHQIR